MPDGLDIIVLVWVGWRVRQVSDQMETIAAVATPRGEGGISIVRISGQGALAILKQVFRPARSRSRYTSRKLYLGHVTDQDGVTIDQVLAVFMPGPTTYTGEDVVEIHTHGGLVVTGEVLRRVLQAGARLARPGEFTERAFLSGKLDLVQAEAVIDLIQASAGAAARQAERHLEGEFSVVIRRIRGGVLELLSQLRAAVDFPDEEIPELAPTFIATELSQLQTEVERLLATSLAGRVIREGIQVVIAGRPNVGKSSLLNALVGREKAIVTEYAGTTRDIVEEYVAFGGVPVRLMDTAGLHAASDPVEQIGVERARQAILDADLVLVVLDQSRPLQDEDWAVLSLAQSSPHLVVCNKADLGRELQLSATLAAHSLAVSATTGTGLDELRSEIVSRVLGRESLEDSVLVANARQEAALRQTLAALQDARTTLAMGLPQDMLSVDLDQALQSLGSLLGETTDEAVIADIFARFCIGK